LRRSLNPLVGELLVGRALFVGAALIEVVNEVNSGLSLDEGSVYPDPFLAAAIVSEDFLDWREHQRIILISLGRRFKGPS